ncbi:frizzled-10-A [Biomphalaria pfeifferi]|uniref:Frizzled-10-A n=1 Tax=Biomphalaria pfeifferi TaxID=112525 RepID=A0AAD8ASU4_BIOPF|nr:frizzled-10-A [Biomphalaria pfeifferi]
MYGLNVCSGFPGWIKTTSPGRVLLLVAAVLCGSVDRTPAHRLENHYQRCEPITIKMCKDMRYNMTSMPNYVGEYSVFTGSAVGLNVARECV